MTVPNSVLENKHIILFDGVCNLCSGLMQFVYKYDRNRLFKFAWIQSDESQEILRWLNMPQKKYDTIVYIESGRAYFKSTAFLKFMRNMPFPWSFAYYGRFVPLKVRNWIYDLVAANRYRVFGRKEACLIPTGDLNNRFL
jgi:predicted DCC family thiol-disulfide oxidoreductase YuxK